MKKIAVFAALALAALASNASAVGNWTLLCSGNGGAGSSWQQINTTGNGVVGGAQTWDEFKGCTGSGSSSPHPASQLGGSSTSTTPTTVATNNNTTTGTTPTTTLYTPPTCATNPSMARCSTSTPTPLSPIITLSTQGNRGSGGVQQWGQVSVGGVLVGNITVHNNVRPGATGSAPVGTLGVGPITTVSNSGGTTTTTQTRAIGGATQGTVNQQVGTLTTTTVSSKPVTTWSSGSAVTTSTSTTTNKIALASGATITATQVCTTTIGYSSSCRTHSGRCVITVCH